MNTILNLANEAKLSNPSITALTAELTGKKANRAATKADAVRIFFTSLQSRVGQERAQAEAPLILGALNGEAALDALRSVVFEANQAESAAEAEALGVESAPEATEDGQGDTEEASEPQASPEATDGAPQPSSARRGRKPGTAGQKIFALKDANPRREGSHGFRSFQLILDRPGITTEDFIAAGGRMNDLRWDIAHGNAETRGS